LKRLVVKGLKVNQGDYDQRTPLHLACSAGHLDIVKYLIENGADINCKDRWGATPLNDTRDQEIIKYLISKGGLRGVD
jgi:ankyrin repeat protein